jgi:hypothetical protein
MSRWDRVIVCVLATAWAACQGPRDHALGVAPSSGDVNPGSGGMVGSGPPGGGGSATDSGSGGPVGVTGNDAGQLSGAGTTGHAGDASVSISDGPASSIGNQAGATDGPLPDVPQSPPAPVAVCGNGAIETGEECDPPGSCPTACANQGCTRFVLQGVAAQCTARCVEVGQETACRNGDGCCPAACNATNDSDCSVKCDNGAKEGQETCDPLATCPTTCPAQGCQLRKLVNGNTCTAACVNDRQQTACASGDGCCPSTCNSNNDTDCKPRCGNGAVESGETCDPVANCQSQQAACRDDTTTLRRPSGDATKCTFVCEQSARTCAAASDGICPAGCTAANDPDCKKKTGDPCGIAGECQTGFCVAGTCCATACPAPAGGSAACGGGKCDFACAGGIKCPNGTCGECCGDNDCTRRCTRCSGGKCVNQASGQDLKEECPSADCHTGTCDGAGACGIDKNGASGHGCTGACRACQGGLCAANAGVLCAPRACNSGNVEEGHCDAAGNCTTQRVQTCKNNEQCVQAMCMSVCGGENQDCCPSPACNSGLFCDTASGKCLAKRPVGGACLDGSVNRDDWCKTNYCGRSGQCIECGANGQNCCTSGTSNCGSGLNCSNACPKNKLDPSDRDSICSPDPPAPGFVCPI